MRYKVPTLPTLCITGKLYLLCSKIQSEMSEHETREAFSIVMEIQTSLLNKASLSSVQN